MGSVSAIIATYNCAPYLAESVDSILAQTHPPAEVVVVDDGSTDDTTNVLARYAERITVVHRAHAGYAAARNTGLQHARGDWIAFHDADDVALPDRLMFQLDYLETHPDHDAVFCNGERMGSGNGAPRLVPSDLARACDGRVLTVGDVFDGFPVYLQAALVARRAFDVTGPFDVTLPVYTDMDYGYRLFTRAQVAFVDRVVFRYRQHATNVTRNRLSGREDIARILERIHGTDPTTAQLIGRQRLRQRLARHYYRIGRRHAESGDPAAAAAAFGRAAALQPCHLRYRLAKLWREWRRPQPGPTGSRLTDRP